MISMRCTRIFFCNNCYAKMLNFEACGSIHNILTVSWSKHLDSNCTACAMTDTNCKGGRPKKFKGRKGRPKTSTTPETAHFWSGELLNNIYLQSPTTNISHSLNELDLYLTNNTQLESVICKFCHDIIKRPVALDCCGHVFCAICLTEHRKGKAHKTCINCNMEIEPSSTSVKPASILAKVLDSLSVKLNCGCIVQLASSKNHVCSISTNTIESKT